MLLAPHILVGAAIASNTANPILGFIFAFVSHFLLDRVPHWEYSIEPLKQIKERGIRRCLPILRRIAVDIALGFLIVFIATKISRMDIPLYVSLAGGFFGLLPDGLTFLLFIKKRKEGLLAVVLKSIYIVHLKIHYSKDKGLPPLRIGLSTQAITALLAVYFLIA